MTPTPGQLEFIEDLMEKLDLTRDDLDAVEEGWGQYERLPVLQASELLDWLQDHPRRRLR